jgi:hypothetical protein
MKGSGNSERRDTSAAGNRSRAQFDASATLLRDLGLSAHAVEYIKRRARMTRRLPHELLVEIVEAATQDTH